ncbi:MAG: hypothetical protein FWD33_00490 [Alphaproteobacteria bacterium]|nr:hypothetical protein [Alphaproteobacteria bacterium]
MQNKKLIIFAALLGFATPAYPTEIDLDAFDTDGSVFLRITELEQEKVLMRLEKERAQLELDLKRIEVERQRIAGTVQTASAGSVAEQVAAGIEAERKKLAAEMDKIRKQMEDMRKAEAAPERVQARTAAQPAPVEEDELDISDLFRIISITGSDGNLTANIENITTGQRRRLGAGRSIDGFKIVSVSADDGVVFELDGEQFPLGLIQNARPVLAAPAVSRPAPTAAAAPAATGPAARQER